MDESTDGVAAAALNALNLDWAQISSFLNLPRNQPIQIRIVATKIPQQQPIDNIASPTSKPSAQVLRLERLPGHVTGCPPVPFADVPKQPRQHIPTSRSTPNGAVPTSSVNRRFLHSNLPNGATKVGSFPVMLQAPRNGTSSFASPDKGSSTWGTPGTSGRTITGAMFREMMPALKYSPAESGTSTPSTVSQTEFSKSRESSPASPNIPDHIPADFGEPQRKRQCLPSEPPPGNRSSSGTDCQMNPHPSHNFSAWNSRNPLPSRTDYGCGLEPSISGLQHHRDSRTQKKRPVKRSNGSFQKDEWSTTNTSKLYPSKDPVRRYPSYLSMRGGDLRNVGFEVESPGSLTTINPPGKKDYDTILADRMLLSPDFNNSRRSSCARTRPFIPKSQRPPQDLPNPKSRYQISPTSKGSRKEALAHFGEVADEIAKDTDSSIPALSHFLKSQTVKMEEETSKGLRTN